MKNTYRFSDKDIAPAFDIWFRDFNGEKVTKTELEFSTLAFAAERIKQLTGQWPTLKEVQA
jgi:hypothetical protein